MENNFTRTIAIHLLLFFALFSSANHAQYITTVAGGGLGNGGAAISAPINALYATEINPKGIENA